MYMLACTLIYGFYIFPISDAVGFVSHIQHNDIIEMLVELRTIIIIIIRHDVGGTVSVCVLYDVSIQ